MENVQCVLLICKCEVRETYCAAAPVVSNCAASGASLAYLMNNFTVCGVKKAGVCYLARHTVSIMLAGKLSGCFAGRELRAAPLHNHHLINVFPKSIT